MCRRAEIARACDVAAMHDILHPCVWLYRLYKRYAYIVHCIQCVLYTVFYRMFYNS